MGEKPEKKKEGKHRATEVSWCALWSSLIDLALLCASVFFFIYLFISCCSQLLANSLPLLSLLLRIECLFFFYLDAEVEVIVLFSILLLSPHVREWLIVCVCVCG